MAWLNSDDMYQHGALYSIAAKINNEGTGNWIVGSTVVIDENKKAIRTFTPVCDTDDWEDFPCNMRAKGTPLPQPSTLWSCKAWTDSGFLDESLQYLMDFEYWVRLASHGYRRLIVPDDLALFRLTEFNKSGKARNYLF